VPNELLYCKKCNARLIWTSGNMSPHKPGCVAGMEQPELVSKYIRAREEFREEDMGEYWGCMDEISRVIANACRVV
jgi:hypothetical protein